MLSVRITGSRRNIEWICRVLRRFSLISVTRISGIKKVKDTDAIYCVHISIVRKNIKK